MRFASVLALLVIVLVTGCANIPEESTPHAVRNDDKITRTDEIQEPSKDLNAFDLVREFIQNSGNPERAKMYLTDRARPEWPGELRPTLIHNTFATVPIPAADSKQAGEDPNGGAVTVVLQVTQLGRIGQDDAFFPSVQEEKEDTVDLRRTKDGQWRIDRAPDAVYVPLTNFESSYRAVTVYYFDTDLRIIVPDLRYVQAEPVDGLPDRVITVLLNGPSDTLRKTVKNPLDGVSRRTNVVPDADGTLVVDLNQLGDKTNEQREQIAAQIVLSLQTVTSSRLRIRGDGQNLIQGHGDWRVGDLKAYDALTKPTPGQSEHVVSGGLLRSLRDGRPVNGPAGNGEYQVVSAAQSLDGGQLAAVTQTPGGARLRIGQFGAALDEVALNANTMTRPTWLVSTLPDQPSNEVWTVADGNVVRVRRAADETWKPAEVNASALDDFGSIIQLRLSRDGTRAAVITSTGRLVVASVVRDKESVSLSVPRTLQETMIVLPVSVDWYDQDTLVVATRQTDLPVVNVSVDGLKLETYDPNNLRPPVRAVTAAPDRDIVVTDSAAVLHVSGLGQVWRQLQNSQGADAIPFYPG